MESTKILLSSGIETEVKGIFYIYNQKYYFMYTMMEPDDDPNYIKLYLTQVGKEVITTPTGPMETGYMLGVEIKDPNEWKNVQPSITQIVEDKKNNTKSELIQYLPISMLVNLKATSSNKFKLLRQTLDSFGLNSNNEVVNNNLEEIQPEQSQQAQNNIENVVVVDYRTKFFEEQEKNKDLEKELDSLKKIIENVKNALENDKI